MTYESETGAVRICTVPGTIISEEFEEIIDETNDYLEKNQNNVSLEALKDIASRISDNAFALSTSKISFPMYYGLMGTYAGVAIGLLEFYLASDGGEEGMFNISTLYPFLGGVVVAMLTSLFGLIFTTNNNRNASKTEDIIEDGRDAYFAFLQKDVVSKTPSTIAQTLKSSVSELQDTVKTLSSSLTTAFEGITVAFGNSLKEDLSSIQELISGLRETTQALDGSMRDQHSMVTNMLGPDFSAALDKIATTVKICKNAVPSIEKANEKLEHNLALQSNFAEVQASLASSQQSFAESQAAVNNAIAILKSDIEAYQEDLKARLEAEKTATQNEFLINLQNTRQMFADISSILDRFKTFEEHANKFAEAEVGLNSGILEKVDKQIGRIERVRTKIDEYIEESEDILKVNLTENQKAIKDACDKFKKGWGDMFYQMDPDNLVKPEDFLAMLNRMEGLIQAIIASIPPQSNHSEIITELSVIKQGITDTNVSISSKTTGKSILSELDDIKGGINRMSSLMNDGGRLVKGAIGSRSATTHNVSTQSPDSTPQPIQKKGFIRRLFKRNKS